VLFALSFPVKAYYKANEERKELNQEINETRNSINTIKDRQDLAYQVPVNSALYTASSSSNNYVRTSDLNQDPSSRMSMADYYHR
jgi:hypothetical protein